MNETPLGLRTMDRIWGGRCRLLGPIGSTLQPVSTSYFSRIAILGGDVTAMELAASATEADGSYLAGRSFFV